MFCRSVWWSRSDFVRSFLESNYGELRGILFVDKVSFVFFCFFRNVLSIFWGWEIFSGGGNVEWGFGREFGKGFGVLGGWVVCTRGLSGF